MAREWWLAPTVTRRYRGYVDTSVGSRLFGKVCTMRHPSLLHVTGAVVLVASTLAVPAQMAVQASAHPASQFATAIPTGPADFDTRLTGFTTDKKHMVTLEVSRSAGGGSVQITVAVDSGQVQRATGSNYQFSVPGSDLVIDAKHGKASLDTHKHLGKYGHITVQWTYTSRATTVQIPADPCLGLAASATTITRVLATGDAQLALTFPCEGVVSAQLHGTNVDIDNGAAPVSPSSSSYPASVLFTDVVATRSSHTGSISVIAYKTKRGPSSLILSISNTLNATVGLLGTSHYATDTLAGSALTIDTRPLASLSYRGALGTANLVFSGKGQSINATRPVRCINPNASKADLAKNLSVQMAQATVSGPVNLTACNAVKTTFGKGDTGIVMTTSLSTAPVATPPAGASPVPGVTPPSTGSMSIVKTDPADGVTGVPTNVTFNITLSAAPAADAKVLMVLTAPSDPTATQMLQPTVSGTTVTATPAQSLKANTQYKLQVVIMGAAGSMPVTASITFTTGS
jgi:methionine-rich copper-binding protein CopC